ncbi:hypothetical protein CRYUN_Cryun22dG0014400 [Craigia yunnanensis]
MQALLRNNKFALFRDKVVWKKLEKGLIPIFQHVSTMGIEVNLEDVFQRFDYDNMSLFGLGFDPNSLTVEFPAIPSKEAFADIEEALLYRHFLPVSLWKFQHWLQIGEEKKLIEGKKILDDFVYNCISSRRETFKRNKAEVEEEDEFDLLTSFLVENQGESGAFEQSDKFVRDTAVYLMLAGIDSNMAFLSEEELNKFIYLYAVFYETLRLYPPIPANHKTVVQPDILPSGHRVDSGSRILISIYSMGRMEEIWGKGCLEFKPERAQNLYRQGHEFQTDEDCGLVCNLDRIFDFFTHDILDLCGGTFKNKRPWFPSLDFVLTSNPMNVNYILSKNFLNYEKGSEFREIFEPFREGIVTSDSDSWKSQRKSLQSLMIKNNKFAIYQDIIFKQVLEKGLIPVVEHIVKLGIEVDLEDVLQRFDYENICLLALGFDPKALSVSFPEVPSKVAFNDIEDALMYRYLMPVSFWKLQRWLQIGEEKRLSKALKIDDHFLYDCISSKREKLRSTNKVEEDEFDLLTALLVEQEGEILIVSGKISDKFLRDTAINFLAAGKDTISAVLSWFFLLLATIPSVETKILQEIKVNSPTTLCETLRLYPPVPINYNTAIRLDVLPSGDHVDRNARILIFFFSMGRMEEIWGKDCLEFKPERWISEHGDIVHIPTYKFTAFSAGPRTCLGIFSNRFRLLEYLTHILILNGGSFEFKGPWFPHLNFIVTSNFMDVNHILCRNFDKYEKGSAFKEIFLDSMGEGIFNSDSDSWNNQRNMLMSLVHSSKFERLVEKIVRKKLEKSLIPILEQKWFQIGEEKKMSKAFKILDDHWYKCISSKREKQRTIPQVLEAEEDEFDLLTALMVEEEGKSNKFLRDTVSNIIAAGTDTISAGLFWFSGSSKQIHP